MSRIREVLQLASRRHPFFLSEEPPRSPPSSSGDEEDRLANLQRALADAVAQAREAVGAAQMARLTAQLASRSAEAATRSAALEVRLMSQDLHSQALEKLASLAREPLHRDLDALSRHLRDEIEEIATLNADVHRSWSDDEYLAELRRALEGLPKLEIRDEERSG